jgi:cytochrome c553
MRFCLRPSATSASAVALGACLAIGFAAQDRAEAQGDAKAGRQKAEVCAVCHGLDGLAKIPEAPNLAGQSEGYLIEQITAFKSGERKNEMMSVVVQDLSPTDIENLAAYYSAIEISVGKTPAQ